MAIPRVRADQSHDVVYAGDADVIPNDPDASGWIPACDARVLPGADVVRLHPLNGPDLRHAFGAGVDFSERRTVNLGVRDRVLLGAAVDRVNELRGTRALEELWMFPGPALGALSDYVFEISNPIDRLASEGAEGAPDGTPKSDGG
uniref:Uncharacterized protein n=1 Tax=viral metagenome TaxID=1070528 RepID=A0A6M3J5V2_9ZZZZ